MPRTFLNGLQAMINKELSKQYEENNPIYKKRGEHI